MIPREDGNIFVVCDDAFYESVKIWLEQSETANTCIYDRTLLAFGVSIARFASEGSSATLVLIDPRDFAAAKVREVLQKFVNRHIHVVAPAIIQYFASRIAVDDPIFKAIDWLANYPVIIGNPPIFEFAMNARLKFWDIRKHSSFVQSLPQKKEDITLRFLASCGRPVDFEELTRIEGLASKIEGAEPIDPHAGVVASVRGAFLMEYVESNIVAFDRHRNRNSKDGLGYARLAYDDLMLTFPSRDLILERRDGQDKSEIEKLCEHINSKGDHPFGKLSVEKASEVATYNRQQWDFARKTLEQICLSLPETPKARPSNPNAPEAAYFNKFAHIVVSNFTIIQSRIGLLFSNVSYVGLPLLARNGVCFALGRVKAPEDQESRLGVVRYLKRHKGECETQMFNGMPQDGIISHLMPSVLKIESVGARNSNLAPVAVA